MVSWGEGSRGVDLCGRRGGHAGKVEGPDSGQGTHGLPQLLIQLNSTASNLDAHTMHGLRVAHRQRSCKRRWAYETL